MPNIPIEIQKKHIETFIKARPTYQEYAKKLEQVLQKAANMYAPFGIVQARAKTVNSFSEKIIRKDKYKNPMVDMTDLCGARVITHFSDQVVAISHFLEENFEVDWENSVDVKTRLDISEFGYRSIHYILSPKKEEVLGVAFPDKLKSLKAEIQVRTFHEHIWADICHDRIYKSTIKVSDEWKRESARLAAILEQADNSFAEMSGVIDNLTISNLPTPHPAVIEKETEVLKTLIKMQPQMDADNLKLRLKLASIYNSTDSWDLAIELLEPFLAATDKFDILEQANLNREIGFALLNSGKTKEGIALIEQAKEEYLKFGTKEKELALCYAYLAGTKETNVLENISLAHKHAPGSPYYFTDFLIEEVTIGGNGANKVLNLLHTKIKETLKQCENHVELGIEVVKSYAAIGKLEFLLGNNTQSLDAYLSLMRVVKKDENIFSKKFLINEVEKIEKLESFNSLQSTIILGLLHHLMWDKYKYAKSKEFLSTFVGKKIDNNKKVLIICGNSGNLDSDTEKEYDAYIHEALLDFNGTVISGGTAAGIPGITGKIAELLRKSDDKSFTLLGYLPKTKKTDDCYDDFVLTDNDKYSVLEAIKYWADIVLSDISPAQIMVLGIHGGKISSAEFRLALILGARVCLVSKLGGSAQTVANDPAWNKMPNLVNVPNDPYTVWALVNQDKKGQLSQSEIETLAPIMHEYYREKRRISLNPVKEMDINKYRVVMKWDKLAPDLQQSNKRQVAFMEHILNRGGLQIQKSDNPKLISIDDKIKTLPTMGKLEHGRWNAERLLDGWHLGPKDVIKKATPYLVAWDELDDDIKTYDFDPIKNFPEILIKIGYEIVVGK